MATNTKDLNIKMVVDHSQVDAATKSVDQLDNATQKVETTTKELSKGVSIVYDKFGKAIDVVTDSEARLTRQNSALLNGMNELRLKGQQNTAEFTLLQKRHLELTSTIEKTKGASRDLFGTFSMLPGEIGKFAGELQVGVELVKVFGGLTFEGLKTQFQELGQVAKESLNLGHVGTSTNKAGAEVGDTLATGANTAIESQNTTATGENSKAQLGSAEAKGLDVIATKKDSIATLENSLAKLEDSLATEKNTLAQQKDTIARLNSIAATGDLTVMTELDTVANERNLTIDRIKTTELFKSAAASELVAQKEALATLTTKEATVETWSLNGAIKAITSSFLFWAGVIAAVGYAVYKYIDGLVILNKTEKEGLEIQKKSGELGLENITLLNTLIATVKRSDLTQREKNKAVNDYNEKLGETLGKVKTYDELEKKLISNGPAYIEYLNIKSKAEAAYALSIETTKQAIAKGAEDPTASLNWADKFIGFEFGLADSTMKKAGAKNRDTQKKELEKTASDYFELFTGFQKEAVALAEKLKLPVPKIKTEKEPVDKAVEEKKKIQEELNKVAEEDYSKTLSDRDRELYIAGGKYNDLLEKAKKYHLDTTALTEGFRMEEASINKKYDEEDKKKTEERKKQTETFTKQIAGIEIDAIKQQSLKSIELRNEKYREDEKALKDNVDFKQLTTEKQTELLTDLEKKKNLDIDKIRDDEHIKTMESEKSKVDERIKAALVHNKQYYNDLRESENDNNSIINAQIQENFNQGLTNEQERNNALEQEATRHKTEIHKIKKAEWQGTKEIIEQGIDATVQLLGALTAATNGQSKKDKDRAIFLIRLQEALTIGKIALDYGSAIADAVAASPLTFGLPWSAIYLAQGAASAIAAGAQANQAVDAINSAGTGGGTSTGDSFNRGKNYGDGGIINGPLHSSPQGGVPIMAEGGEAVMTRGAVTMFRPLLSMLNQAGGGTSFTGGAMGQAPYDAPESNKLLTETPIIKTYIVENELTSIQERQSRLKSLSTL